MEYVFTNAFKGMEDALVDFVKTGKLDFGSLVNSMISDMIRFQIQQNITEPFMKGFAGGGGFAGGLSAIFGSFDGGGFTGSGSRSGGVDGKGGFMALLHPNETVIDHTKGQVTPVAARGGSSGQNVEINISNVIGNVASQSDVVTGMQVVRGQILQELSRAQRYGGALA